MLAGTFFHTGLGLGLGFSEEDLDLDLHLRIVDLDLHFDLAVAGLVTSLMVSRESRPLQGPVFLAWRYVLVITK